MAIGAEPSPEENAALASALAGYAKRSGPDDFTSFTKFLEGHPKSPWRAAVLTGLGTEYYNTAHYSLALAAWTEAWTLTKNATDQKGKAIADRAAGELAYMHGRLGQMQELEILLKSVEGREFIGSATEKISGAKEGLWNMQNHPEISFRCGPLALLRIQTATNPTNRAERAIYESASTQKGFSLPQVAKLSKKIGLNYQMAFREKGGEFVVPAVVHWKLSHYAAIIRHEGDKYLLQDPTFLNDVWATKQALEAETSGYFLIPPGPLPNGWRTVEAKEGDTIWGKGNTQTKDPGVICPDDSKSRLCKLGKKSKDDYYNKKYPKIKLTSEPGTSLRTRANDEDDINNMAGRGMAVSDVHLMLVNLNLVDEPVGYSPPVGPDVRFTVRYNHRDAFQPGTFTYANFGPKWTCDWVSYITDNPQSLSADVNYYVQGGGNRTFSGFNTNTQTFAYQFYDDTQLKRTGTASYEMLWNDGSKMVFAQSNGSIGTSRKVFLTQILDSAGNTVTLNYDGNLRVTGITDAIGQVTTLTYSTNDTFKITRVTDPFGRFASFSYDTLGRLTNITDVIGLNSRFVYEGSGDFINALITPYGTNSFIRAENGTTRSLETVYADGSRDRVEFNQGTALGVPFSDPANTVPQGMNTGNNYLWFRNTYYWSRSACATSYGDYSKAKLYHWLHTSDVTMCSGALESTKEALEGRVWRDYAGQGDPIFVGANNRPTHVGRVLDDGSTQLYTYGYNAFGNLTNTIDPRGRTFSYIYATNGIDLLEGRMTRAGKNELLSKVTYNAQHLPLTTTDAAGQTTTNTYNARGQLLTVTNPKNETTTYTYNTNGFLIASDGPLPGTNDVVSVTYDSFGRLRTKTETDGYTVTFDYDALDRRTRITFPDGTFDQKTYDRLDASVLQDRAGRQTLLEHNPVRDLVKRTDALGRVTQFQWCRCGSVKSIIDPLGRTTQWETDVQGRLVAKIYGDGSRITYGYEARTSRLRQITDEKLQLQQLTYYPDNSLASASTVNSLVPTAPLRFVYDPDYPRLISLTDGTGTTLQQFVSITVPPTLGAGLVATVDGPLPNDSLTYAYDELGHSVGTTINGVTQRFAFDALGRLASETNLLGTFTYAYDGTSGRMTAETNSILTTTRAFGDNLHDHELQRIKHQFGATPISDFFYSHDAVTGRITTWSQQFDAAAPQLFTFGYDGENQLVSATITNGGVLTGTFAYTYDTAANRLIEKTPARTNTATHNALNQLNTVADSASANRTNEWDARDRLVAVNAGNQRTEFTYDGISRLAGIRQLVNGVETSHRQFVWSNGSIAEERDGTGALTKRYFQQGVKIESGPKAGTYLYTRDHLNSVRELVDASGNVRARYSYDPFGRRTLVSGDVAADFGFAGMFWSSEAQLSIARYRVYDPELGRWLSRDPLRNAELREGANLYWYAANNPVNVTDPSGLCCENQVVNLWQVESACDSQLLNVLNICHTGMGFAGTLCIDEQIRARTMCINSVLMARAAIDACERGPCREGCEYNPPPLPPRMPRLPGGAYGLPELDAISPPFGFGPQGSGGSSK